MSEERAGHTVGGRVPFSTTWRCKCDRVQGAATNYCAECGEQRPPESYWPHDEQQPKGEVLFRLNWDELRAVQKVRREAFQRLGMYRASETGWPQVTEAYERLIEIDTEIDRRKDEEDL